MCSLESENKRTEHLIPNTGQQSLLYICFSRLLRAFLLIYLTLAGALPMLLKKTFCATFLTICGKVLLDN